MLARSMLLSLSSTNIGSKYKTLDPYRYTTRVARVYYHRQVLLCRDLQKAICEPPAVGRSLIVNLPSIFDGPGPDDKTARARSQRLRGGHGGFVGPI